MSILLTKVDEHKKLNPNIGTYLGGFKNKEKFYENLDLKLGQVLV